jgi:hypothetical protein
VIGDARQRAQQNMDASRVQGELAAMAAAIERLAASLGLTEEPASFAVALDEDAGAGAAAEGGARPDDRR